MNVQRIVKLVTIFWSLLWIGWIGYNFSKHLPKMNDFGLFWGIVLSIPAILLGIVPAVALYLIVKWIIRRRATKKNGQA